MPPPHETPLTLGDARATRTRLETAHLLLDAFAARTGLTGSAPPRRYLWTDAFAVCSLLELHRLGGDPTALDTARTLVDQVHEVLGHHRSDDTRTGWISGLPEHQGRVHPTLGGLRIGKRRSERGPGEPFDEQAEWERDGQYFHYLTRWMLALSRLAAVAGDTRLLHQAVELARAAHQGFWRAPRGAAPGSLAWKMSIDLSRPLVPSTGHHDPLDGLLTLLALQHAARRTGLAAEAASLDRPVGDLRGVCHGTDWTTVDPLGLGGLLADAWRLAQLSVEEPAVDAPLLPWMLVCATQGLSALVHDRVLSGPASRRLAFRELGLAIGLHALQRLDTLVARGRVRHLDPHVLESVLEPMRPYVQLAGAVEGFWLEPAHQAALSWTDHEDINAVMLAASLLPDGVLTVVADDGGASLD